MSENAIENESISEPGARYGEAQSRARRGGVEERYDVCTISPMTRGPLQAKGKWRVRPSLMRRQNQACSCKRLSS